ncbi:hypothetical protein DL93DRAFT_621900 [Clavulina sp. PMI_390]|nr:hypothetical protein DL93DRAFT_621900 [Clavulina sp. PMI_390]
MPEDLDLKQFRNFVNPDMWFDESTSVPSSALPIPVVMVDRGSPSPREMMADHVRRTGRRPGTPKKRLPLLVPRAFEFLSMVSEHRDDLPSIRKEISSFLQQMNEAVRGKAQWTYLPRALTGAQDLLREVNSVRLRDHFFLKIYINVVRFACSLAKLPSVESMDPHVGFFFGMRKILEPISINLALILRLLAL